MDPCSHHFPCRNRQRRRDNASADYVVENDRRNSGVPLLDMKGIKARIEPGAVIREKVEIGEGAVIMMGAVIAGLPATTALSGTSSITTAPAATTAFLPTWTPSITTALAPTGSAKVFGSGNSFTVFGDWTELAPILEANAGRIADYVVENERFICLRTESFADRTPHWAFPEAALPCAGPH